MYSPLEMPGLLEVRRANMAGKKTTSWGATGLITSVIRATNRRLQYCGHFMCRLPLLVLWVIIVLILLYNSSSSISSDNTSSTITFEAQVASSAPNQNLPHMTTTETSQDEFLNQDIFGDRQSQDRTTPTGSGLGAVTGQQQQAMMKRFSEPISSDKLNNTSDEANLEYVIPTTSAQQTTPPLMTTRKSPTSEYLRQSKVFILIVQEEHFHFDQSLNKNVPVTTVGRMMKPRVEEFTQHHRIVIPAHIRKLIEILESHRIGYSIDTTRYGLPNQLIAGPDSKQYSVIVLDDFLKYQRLNRWLRDQLDRHCRLNEIGVITYLTQSEDFTYSTSTKADLYHVLSQRSASSSPTVSPIPGFTETPVDQYPFTIKQINSMNCKDSSSKNCLVDYQLNERASILRILKRRPDFIMKGELRPDLIPWVSISSNHITYEPLTWAKSRHLRPTRSSSASFSSASDTQLDNQYRQVRPPKKRAALMSEPKFNQNDDKKDGLNSSSSSSEDNIGGYDGNEAYDEGLVPAGENQHEEDDDHQQHQLDPKSDWHETSSSSTENEYYSDQHGEQHVLSMFDKGLYDGIRRAIFGVTNEHWINRCLVLDAIEHLSMGRIITPLERYIQIDIDDIFVGERGIRMNASDVENLIEAQRTLSALIDGGFKFNLGFSGNYFKRGYDDENLGDEMLIARANEFTWFCHFWSHSKAHLFNDTKGISNELRKNLEFARDKKLPIIGYRPDDLASLGNLRNSSSERGPTYAVAPHHSGVYPIHEQLYEAWREVLNVQVTSTEEYPHLKPAHKRRAFVHKTIKVLPRQTCGLYTHTIYRRKYPGGFGRLLASISGGELFQTVLHNQVNIYMSHMSNYANDRLAPFTFLQLVKFVQLNTNLQLKYAPSVNGDGNVDNNKQGDHSAQLGPMILAEYYFSLYPSEREPLWTNPCKDSRHLAIWSAAKQRHLCPLVPSLLIVGPQKTGTTALHSFLKINHSFRSSSMSSEDYEEIQFFNDKHYLKGVDWYLERFKQQPSNSDDDQFHLFFDKSATYFDDPKAPQRAYSLLPDARIAILLLNPADRAYSWYQHIKAHHITGNNQTSSSFLDLLTFEQILRLDHLEEPIRQDLNGTTTTGSSSSSTTRSTAKLNPSQLREARSLRARCLQPGLYARHLMRWLEFFAPYQIIIIDSEWFKYNPAAVLNRLQLLLRVPKPIDYNNHLALDKDKGFYCQKEAAKVKCLGPSKGRRYEPMSRDARAYLNAYYRQANRQLSRLLSEIGQPLPNWLDESINLMN